MGIILSFEDQQFTTQQETHVAITKASQCVPRRKPYGVLMPPECGLQIVETLLIAGNVSSLHR